MRAPRGTARQVAVACATLVAATALVATGPAAEAASCPVVSATGVVTPAPAQNVDWHGCTLAHAHLSGADLTNADLSGADLSGATLTGATLVLTRLTGANLTGADVERADLNSATITGATITGSRWGSATLFRTRSGSLVGTPATLPDAGFELVSGYLLGPWADLTGADLHGVTVHTASLVNATLRSANLAGADLTGRDLRADLTDADLTGAVLTTADLTYADFTRTDLTGADATGATLDNALFDHSLLTGTVLGSARANRVRSVGVVGTPASLPSGWEIAQGYLVGPAADLRKADLGGADLTGQDLRTAWMQGADLSGADLTGADLTRATLTGSTVTGAVLTGATLTLAPTGSLVGTPAALPTNWLLRAGYLVGPGAGLALAALDGADLSGAHLAGAFLHGAHLAGADLTGADLTSADLGAADLTGASVGGADLTSAVLLRVRASAVVGTPSHLPTGWRLYHQILFGPGANLNGLDLSGLDLSGIDLTGAALASTTVTGTGFAGATLTQVYSGSIVGTPASLPSPWSIVGGFLVGPTASLSFAHLDGLDLSGATLDHASLTGASLVGTDLTARDLTGATLSSANLTDAHLAGATLDNAAVTFANLTRADLTGAVAHAADLSGSTLTSAKLGAADLSTSVLQAVVSRSVTGTPAALPASWHLVHGYLVGPGADLSGADLRGQKLAGFDLHGIALNGGSLAAADLHGADLTSSFWIGVSLVDADLRGATLTSADLSSSDLSRANLTGAAGLPSTVTTKVRWTGTVCPDGRLAAAHRDGTCRTALDTRAPVAVALAAPAFTTSRRFLMRWSATDDGVVAGVRYRLTRSPAGSTRITAVSISAWLPATRTSIAPVGAPASRYCWQVQARDRAGRLSAWSTVRCTSVPIDTHALRRSVAWTESTTSAWFGRTVATAAMPGATLSTPTSLVVRRVGVIASTCSTCGALDVYVGATRVGRISLQSSTTVERKLLVLPLLRARRAGVVRFVVVSALNRSLDVDAVVISAT